MIDKMAPVAKAIAAGLVAALGSLALFITGDEGFGDVTTGEWITAGVNVLAAYGIVWTVPNRPVEPQ